MIRSLFIVASIAFVTGCSSTPKPTVVTNVTTVYKPLPESLLKKCPIPKPITKDEYLSKDVMEREIWLTTYNIKLLKELGNCNIQIDSIKTLNDQYIKLYK